MSEFAVIESQTVKSTVPSTNSGTREVSDELRRAGGAYATKMGSKKRANDLIWLLSDFVHAERPGLALGDKTRFGVYPTTASARSISVNWFKSFWKALTLASSGVKPGSFEFASNLTPRAQEALALARKEADRLNHNFIGTEHVLLGLIRLGQGTGGTVLRKMGFDLEKVRAEFEKLLGIGLDQKKLETIPFTPRVKKALSLATKEAKALNHAYVDTEHILLGLLREGDGIAARVLMNINVDLNVERTREAILKEIDPQHPGTETSNSHFA